MEVPDNIKNLYHHWDIHTASRATKSFTVSDHILWFINERNKIWQKKVAGELPPYTDDPILSTYRFCNIFREFDRQTIEFHSLLNPLREDFPLWLLNMFYCRMIARTETIKFTGLLSYDENIYEKLVHSPRPRFGTPYVFPISVIQKSATPTREKFIAEYLPSIMGKIAAEIRTWKSKKVYDGVEKILPLFKYNLRFLWTEVLIDVAYQFPQYVDLFGRFPIGPGSLPTMKKIDGKMDPTILVTELAWLPYDTGITVDGKSLHLSAENWEGIGCEYRKYTNLKAGVGRKRIYARNH